MTIKHSTFTIDRTYDAAVGKVFAAWADPESKARWLAGEGAEYELDFRVGGREVCRGQHPGGPPLTFEACYRDIVTDQRIVFTSTMSARDVLATVSLTTVEFVPEGGGTRLVFTDQGSYLDGHEEPEWRKAGNISQLDALAAELT